VEGKGIIQSSGASIELQKRPVHVLKSRGDLVRKSFENMEQNKKMCEEPKTPQNGYSFCGPENEISS
jgi:hypothetical protein